MHIDYGGVVLQNEADVEMRIIIPLLQGSPYLDIPEQFIKPKKYLAPTPFNRKAGLTSGGFPDFSVWIQSFPVLIVEAKPPDVPVEVGYHEAQMYAAYLNQNYPTGINPAHFVFATNGIDFMAGWRDSKPAISEKVIDLLPQSTVTVEFQKLCGRLILEEHAHTCLLAAKAKRFLLPYNLAGGQALLRPGCCRLVCVRAKDLAKAPAIGVACLETVEQVNKPLAEQRPQSFLFRAISNSELLT